jgi:glutaredoxin-related protein
MLWIARPPEPAMPRPILDEAFIHSAIREKLATNRIEIVREVQEAIAANAVVVVGMRINPAPTKARKLLDAAGIPYKYLTYGSYFRDWRRRTALKMWTGWQTFPMVFVKGVLVGGASDLGKLIDSGELKRLLSTS